MYNKYNNRRNKYNNRNRDEFPQGMTVMVRDNDVNKALRVLKKKLVKDGFFQELRERTFFESKGTKRRKAKDAATRRYKRKMQKRKEELGYQTNGEIMARRNIRVESDTTIPKQKKRRKPMSEEQKVAAAERLAKAREKRLKENDGNSSLTF